LSLKKKLNSDRLNPIGLSKKKMKHANPKDSTLLPDWNDTESGGFKLASRTQDTEEDESMVQSGGFVGDNETDDLERKSVSVFKDGKKKVVVSYLF
jgi:hypothetical protein